LYIILFGYKENDYEVLIRKKKERKSIYQRIKFLRKRIND